MKFRIYYKDGTYYDGEGTEDAMNAPTMGALFLKQDAPCNVSGFSFRSPVFFCWEKVNKELGIPERWGGKDDVFGLVRYWATEKGAQKVLQGEEIDDGLYQDMKAKAQNDGYLDKRAG